MHDAAPADDANRLSPATAATHPYVSHRLDRRLTATAGACACSYCPVSLDVTSPAVGTIHIGILLTVLRALPLALGAWGVVALLDRYSSRPRRTWTVLSVAVLVASLVPLVFLDATAATRVSLAWMHVVCGLILIVLLRRTTLDRRGARRSNA